MNSLVKSLALQALRTNKKTGKNDVIRKVLSTIYKLIKQGNMAGLCPIVKEQKSKRDD